MTTSSGIDLFQHIPTSVYAPIVAAILKLFFERLFREIYQRPLWKISSLSLVALFVFYFTYQTLLSPPGNLTVWMILGIFVLFTVVWGLFFHVVAHDFGSSFTKMFRGEWWVKGIDYVYLVLSFFGLLRVVLGTLDSAPATQSVKYATVVSVLMIAIGVALRITKTTIEIRKWEKVPVLETGMAGTSGQAA